MLKRTKVEPPEYITLLDQPVAPLNPKIAEALNNPEITLMSQDQCNNLLTNKDLQNEIGFTALPNGGHLVAMKTEMPNVNKDMINWWFWWHAQESLRYQIWFPGAHLKIKTNKHDQDYFQKPFQGFQPNTQYPKEYIGKLKATLAIQFINPEEFGFDPSLFAANHIETIVSAYVGVLGGAIHTTEMAHIFKKSKRGLTLISRFWMGGNTHFPKCSQRGPACRLLGMRSVRNFLFSANQAMDMAVHCSQEYSNLAKILPDLYKKYA